MNTSATSVHDHTYHQLNFLWCLIDNKYGNTSIIPKHPNYPRGKNIVNIDVQSHVSRPSYESTVTVQSLPQCNNWVSLPFQDHLPRKLHPFEELCPRWPQQHEIVCPHSVITEWTFQEHLSSITLLTQSSLSPWRLEQWTYSLFPSITSESISKLKHDLALSLRTQLFQFVRFLNKKWSK